MRLKRCEHSLAGMVELAPQGLRVNSVAPTFVETPLTRPMLQDKDFLQFVESSIPLGRVGQVSDVSAAVLYPASPAARLVTGESLKVDGGWTAR